MASLIDRALRLNDWETDGDALDLDSFEFGLTLFSAGLVTRAQVKAALNCSTAQGNDLDDIMDTMPTSILTALNAAARARWPGNMRAILTSGLQGFYGLTTEAACKTAMGI